jgi:hypothetical protein
MFAFLQSLALLLMARFPASQMQRPQLFLLRKPSWPLFDARGQVVRTLTEATQTYWHIRVRRNHGTRRSQTLHFHSQALREKKPCPEARKRCQMMTDACRNLPAIFLSSGLSTKSKATTKSAPSTFCTQFRRPRRPGQRAIRSGWKHVFL